MTSEIWSSSVEGRLRAARALNARDVETVHAALIEGCPVEPWPYGNATSINPLLVTLGPSPGGSPDRSAPDPALRPLDLPTVGERHPHTRYDDPRRFWRKIRHLAYTVLGKGGIDEDDALALFGNMNLDTGRSGQATAVRIEPRFARWILATIRDHLRPRFLVCLGLVSKKEAGHLLAEAFDGFEQRHPHDEFTFHADGKAWQFREWDIVCPLGNAIKVVYWPQHPSRPPFVDSRNWVRACQEFANRHRDLIRP